MPVILTNRGADDWMNLTEADSPSLERPLVPPPDGLLEGGASIAAGKQREK
jgi:hypothetical protein